MNYTIQNIDEITDSKELLNSRPHPFMLIFIYIVIALFLSGITWSYFSEKEIVVKATGIVKPKKDTVNISSKSDGIVSTVNFKDGDSVMEGQILYTLDHSSLDSQKSAAEADLKNYTEDLSNLNKLKDSIEQGTNLFNEDISSEKNYSDKYRKYIQDCSSIDNQSKAAQVQIQGIKDNLSNYVQLQKSVSNNTNYFKESNSFYNQYLDYQINLKQYQNKIDQAQKSLTNLKDSDAVQQSQIDNATLQLNNCNDDLTKYKNQYLTNIKYNIEQNQQKLKELQSNLSASQNSASQYTSKDDYRLNTQIQIQDNIKTTQEKADEINSNLAAINSQIDSCIIKAENDGIINSQVQIHKGDAVEKGLHIGTILPKLNSNYSVDVYISNKDIGNIKNGENIKISLLALPFSEYGNIKSKITQIGADSKVDSKNGSSYYSALSSINKKYLTNHKGEKAEIKPGMICSVDIISRKEKMLDYLLEKLNLKN